MAHDDDTTAFEEARPGLLALAYRMLGSRADAEDAVQDTYLRWHQAERAALDNPAAWLTTVCTRRCLDVLKSHQHSRVDYVGEWLPEPLEGREPGSAGDDPLLAASLSTAFLLMLERLTPRERAAYLLHEIFDTPYSDTARILGIAESACRKLVSRARGHVEQARVRHATPADRQNALLAAFHEAVDSGRTEHLSALFAADIAFRQDSGGKVPAVAHVLQGRDAVLEFVGTFLHRAWKDYAWTVIDLNGGRGALLGRDSKVEAALSLAFDEMGRASTIYLVRNPDKLARLPPT